MITLEIMNAESMKKIKQIMLEKEKAEREAKERAWIEEAKKEREIAIKFLFNTLKEKMMSTSSDTVSIYITDNTFKRIFSDETRRTDWKKEKQMKNVYETLTTLFEMAGYSLFMYTYCKSWYTRSGRYAEMTLRII